MATWNPHSDGVDSAGIVLPNDTLDECVAELIPMAAYAM
jgi:hypothetical protein